MFDDLYKDDIDDERATLLSVGIAASALFPANPIIAHELAMDAYQTGRNSWKINTEPSRN